MPEVDIERCVQDSIKIFQSTPKSVAARQHDCIPTSNNEHEKKVKAKMEKEFVPVEQLKSEKCARISLEDTLQVMDIRFDSSAKSPSKTQSKSWGIVVDIRPSEDYNRSHLLGSINMPSNQTFSENNELVPCDAAATLQASKGKIIIVLGGRANNCPKFAEELLKLGFPRVCVLDAGGMTTMRNNGLMSVLPV